MKNQLTLFLGFLVLLGIALWAGSLTGRSVVSEPNIIIQSDIYDYWKGYQDGQEFMGDFFREYCQETNECAVKENGDIIDYTPISEIKDNDILEFESF